LGYLASLVDRHRLFDIYIFGEPEQNWPGFSVHDLLGQLGSHRLGLCLEGEHAASERSAASFYAQHEIKRLSAAM
jgi:hypothetical protein